MSYSASGGPTLELFADPNLGAYSTHLQESLDRLLERHSELGVKLHVVLVDPYPPLTSQTVDPQKWAKRLQELSQGSSLQSVTAIRFTKPLSTVSAKTLEEEAAGFPSSLKDLPPWLIQSLAGASLMRR